ncbi:MAG TPA: YihY/virulence factor BrkB family protein [Chitinophagaceae bacterium]|nr:YihY/virulence factor BrkB family protein [Chitinophagaceae bacterium]
MIKLFSIPRRYILNSLPVRFVVNKSKKISLPGFQGIPLHDVVKFFFGQVRKVGMVERASAISFNIFMAIPPAIIFLFTLIPYLSISRQFIHEMFGLIRDVIPGEKNNSSIIKFLNDFVTHPRNDLLSLGFLLALFYSSSAMMGIMRSFDKNYLGFKKRKALQQRGIAIKLTLILFVLVVASVLVLVAQDVVLKWIGIENKGVRDVIKNVRWIVIILLFFYIISYIYKHAPSVDKKWKLINAGSILATFLMLLFTSLFSYWVNHFGNYNKLYGSIGTIMILMLLIYFNSLVLLIGFELNVSISSLKRLAESASSKSTA